MKPVLGLFVFCVILQGVVFGQLGSWYQDQVLCGEEDGPACYELQMATKTYVDFGLFKVDYKLANVTVKVVDKERHEAQQERCDLKQRVVSLEKKLMNENGESKIDVLSNALADREKEVDDLRSELDKKTNDIDDLILAFSAFAFLLFMKWFLGIIYYMVVNYMVVINADGDGDADADVVNAENGPAQNADVIQRNMSSFPFGNLH